MKLDDTAVFIRSKMAGPFTLTFDIMFAEQASYDRVKNSRALTQASFAKLYGWPEEKVRFFQCDNALTFKFSIPRPLTQGEPGERDMHGGQQFVPLMNVDIR